jgi:mannose-6-phosphate isomerase-like protein (cupin superfamily)
LHTCAVRPVGSSRGRRRSSTKFTVVLKGMLRVTHREGEFDVHAGQAVVVERGEWVQYSTPGAEGAEYIAVCIPSFSMEMVHRDPS